MPLLVDDYAKKLLNFANTCVRFKPKKPMKDQSFSIFFLYAMSFVRGFERQNMIINNMFSVKANIILLKVEESHAEII